MLGCPRRFALLSVYRARPRRCLPPDPTRPDGLPSDPIDFLSQSPGLRDGLPGSWGRGLELDVLVYAAVKLSTMSTTTTTTHPLNSLFSSTTWVSRYRKSKTSLDLNEARDDGVLGWQWHQLDHMQTICTSLQTDKDTSTSLLKFLRAGCSSRRPANNVKALKAHKYFVTSKHKGEY